MQKNRLSELIDRALEGEDVVITRHGRPVAELRAIPRPARAVTPAGLDWLAARRVPTRRGSQNAGKLLSDMRSEDDE